jgi:DNA repair exonuclease SbcCD ATPase subunit
MSSNLERRASAASADTPEEQRGGIMSSLHALRTILMIDSPTKDLLASNNTSLLQQRYEEQQRALDQIKKLEQLRQDLESRLEDTKKEAEKERSLRKSLEATYGALAEHKKDLTFQLELVTKSREKLEEKAARADTILSAAEESHSKEKKTLETQVDDAANQKVEALEKVDSLESRLLELKAEKLTLTSQIEADNIAHQVSIEGYVKSNENRKRRADETEEAHIKAVQDRIKILQEVS